jgi:hypothetical protein
VKILVLIACCLLTSTLFAQSTYTIKGSAIDTSSKAKVVNTTVCVLNAKDSILIKFTYASSDGSFTITGLPAGKFILLVSFKDYADYSEPFTLDGIQTIHDFGAINMRLKAKLLQEVLIKGKVTAIKIKGDTTEFNAKAYVIQPNDKVEDLLRQLPGMQVDKEGRITANGQAVTKVLVDGEEYFGDDPTLVTKNIRADMVDKVQLYDKKSDQAAFTGIDDAVKIKTINITLKEDKKNGEFGKVSAGVGTNDYDEGQAIYNRFKTKEKYAVYATAANDGRSGLGSNIANNLGVGNVVIGDNGSISTASNNSDALDVSNDTYAGTGLPLIKSGGAHYDGKWNNDKESINTNYKVGSVAITAISTTVSQQTFPGNVINGSAYQTFDNYTFLQKLDATYSLKLDNSSNLKIAADGTIKNFTVNNNYQTIRKDSIGNLINQQSRNIKNSGSQQVFDAGILYTKKFKKPMRTFSWNVSETHNDYETHGYLNSNTNYYNSAGLIDSAENVNQFKTTHTITSVLNSNMTYTEPLTKTMSLAFDYGLSINNSTQQRASFNQSATGVYNVLDTAFSNDYRFSQFANQLGAVINFKKRKVVFNFGTKVADVDFKQVDENTGTISRRTFINWKPQALFQYIISQQSNFTLNYRGYTTQPGIEQLQPVRENNDPQNILIGNAGLKPSFTNSFFLYYNISNTLSQSYMVINGDFSFTSAAIVNNTTTDLVTDKTVTQYVNLNEKRPFNYHLTIYKLVKIKPADVDLAFSFFNSGDLSYTYINGNLNQAKSFNYSASLNVKKFVANKYQFSLRGGPQYTINEFSLEPRENNNAAGLGASGYGTYYLPAKFFIASDITYNYTTKTQAFDALYKTIWNASINKTFLKNDQLKLSLAANDLLAQNINFRRSIYGNTITQSNTNGIKRYFMFSVSWDFTKFRTLPVKN